jgi:hypothetical protein|tara:strand:+ start:805 stop:2010 length:1206 start_codon:yes stop_codon:yes gene_type:complete
MRTKFWTDLMQGRYICGLEHNSRNQDAVITGILLSHSNNELNINASFKEVSRLELVKNLSKHQSISLVINTDKVLSKTITAADAEELQLVYTAFPNLNIEAFYYEVLSQGNTHFINVCRKDYVNALVEKYASQKLFIFNFSLGSLSIVNLIQYTNREVIYNANSKIEIENSKITSISKGASVQENYSLNGLSVSSYQLLSFAAALNTLQPSNFLRSNFSAENKRLKNLYQQSRFFNQFIKFGGIVVSAVLIVNFMYFNHYFSKVNDLEQRSEVTTSTKNKILELETLVTKKEQRAKDLLKSNQSKSAFYSHTIMQSLPNTLLLSSYRYQPLLKKIKEEVKIELQYNTILISGASVKSADLSKWIQDLEALDWIDSIAIMDYHNSDSKTSEFKISILIRHDY